MKYILTLVSVCLIGHYSNAQLGFYLKPTFNFKTNQGNFLGKNDNYKEFTNKYFSIYNHKMYMDFNELNLGINVGVNLNKKHFFEFGVAGDHAGIAVNVKGNTYWKDPESQIEVLRDNSTYTELGSTTYTKFSFSYENLIWKSKRDVFQLRFKSGMGLLFNRWTNPKKGIVQIFYNNAFALGETEPGVYINSHEIKSTAWVRTSLFVDLGFGLDFYTKKRSFYLFSFDVFYLQGLGGLNNGNMTTQEHRINVIDLNNNTSQIYSYFLASKGSGFYFQISRRFQFYPWIPLSKKKRIANEEGL